MTAPRSWWSSASTAEKLAVDPKDLRDGDFVLIGATIEVQRDDVRVCVLRPGVKVSASSVHILTVEPRPIAVGEDVKHRPTGLTVTVEAIKDGYAFVFSEDDITGPFVSRLEWLEREA